MKQSVCANNEGCDFPRACSDLVCNMPKKLCCWLSIVTYALLKLRVTEMIVTQQRNEIIT